ncbi:MAG: hypothetical protein WC365_09400 [Candidatus Babeliales bacterium]|jgi:hypothetical protein
MTLQEIERDKPATISIQTAATIMEVSPQFLRAALMQDRFPFGTGVKMSQNEFYINTTRFVLYMEGSDLINKPA